MPRRRGERGETLLLLLVSAQMFENLNFAFLTELRHRLLRDLPVPVLAVRRVGGGGGRRQAANQKREAYLPQVFTYSVTSVERI